MVLRSKTETEAVGCQTTQTVAATVDDRQVVNSCWAEKG